MNAVKALRQLLAEPTTHFVPACYDAMSARMIRNAGYPLTFLSGYQVSATRLGLPDTGYLTLTEMTAQVRDATTHLPGFPVIVDADTGYGNAMNVRRTVMELAKAGAAGLLLEDQVMPKRCGHLDGKQVVSLEEGVAKIAAAAAARTDKDLVINARTDTLATHGIDEVIRRGNAYLAAGATMIFIDGLDSEANLLKAVRSIKGPVAINLVPGGKSPMLPLSRLQEIGVARASLPGVCLIAAIGAMRRALADVAVNDGVVARPDDREAFRATHALFGMDQVHALESQYLAPLAAKAAE